MILLFTDQSTQKWLQGGMLRFLASLPSQAFDSPFEKVCSFPECERDNLSVFAPLVSLASSAAHPARADKLSQDSVNADLPLSLFHLLLSEEALGQDQTTISSSPASLSLLRLTSVRKQPVCSRRCSSDEATRYTAEVQMRTEREELWNRENVCNWEGGKRTSGEGGWHQCGGEG